MVDWINHLIQKFSYPQVGVEDVGGVDLALAPLANPARGGVAVRFHLPARAAGRLELLDLQGRRLATLDVSALEPGRHEARLRGSGAPAGLLFVRLVHGGLTAITRVATLP